MCASNSLPMPQQVNTLVLADENISPRTAFSSRKGAWELIGGSGDKTPVGSSQMQKVC